MIHTHTYLPTIFQPTTHDRSALLGSWLGPIISDISDIPYIPSLIMPVQEKRVFDVHPDGLQSVGSATG